MIFATVGTQAPFDRFIKALDEIAPLLDEEVIAQTYNSMYVPKNIKIVSFLPPDEFNKLFNDARLIVSHAGMGTIISALKGKKPIVVVPRLTILHEHRNDHQIATAMRMDELGYVYVAYDQKQLKDLLLQKDLNPIKEIGSSASSILMDSLCDYINNI